ncbi:hypothetical protein GETHLI_06390 [Geothrix limicola]|uniref:histidine kinase n=1 Tax=Geothrix limicola TaxID=2927978 RepID=A0ABQ5QBX7_9BACT|nr:ATP-binding protein [Geothrix limicola]GLH72137.1 hypothetical protein GETHLI_06390 [Geothrix limicola]
MPLSPSNQAGRPFPAFLWGVWGLFGCNLVLPWVLPGMEGLKTWFGTCTLAALLLAFGAAFRLWKSGEAPKLTWMFWTLQLGFLLLVRALFAILPGWKASLPRLPWGQPHHLISYALEIAALLTWGAPRRGQVQHLWMVLEDLLFAAGGFFLVWNLGLRDFVAARSLPGPELKLLVALFLVTTLTFGLWASLYLRPLPGDRRRLGWIGLGLLYSLVRNAALSAAHQHGWARLILEVEALDAFTWLCWAQAFLTPRTADHAETAEPSWIKSLFPYLPAVCSLVLVCILLAFAPQRLDWEVVVLLIPMMVLLLWRQGLVMRETQLLAKSLEAQVAQRTRSLEEAQALLLQTERMNTVASIGAGLAHDLNNFIGVSRMYSDLLELDLTSGKTPALKDVQRLKESAVRAGELTAQLMDFARQQDLPAQAFDLGGHLELRRSLLQAVVRPPVQLMLEQSPDQLPVLMDPSKVDQILANLLSNSRDAMPRGGRIWVRSRQDGGQALLEVEDEGVGIPESVRRRIFDPFFTTKPPGRGTGLGLASVKALVAQASGSVDVESEEGRGTIFRLRFPMRELAGA